MLDLKTLRENPDAVRAGAIKKRMPDRAAAVDRALAIDAELRALLPKLDAMRSAQKSSGKELGKLSAAEREPYLQKQKELKAEIGRLEEQERQLRARLDEQMALVPNIPDAEVPEGKDDTENVECKRSGAVREFDFEPRAHYEIGEAQGWIDFTRAAAMAGSRNYMLFGELALLQDAVLRCAVDLLVQRGFVPVDPPLLVRDEAMFGTGFFPGGEEQTYRCDKDGLNLIGTSEVPVTSLHGGEILAEEQLPKKYVARSACFRREAGTHGKDTRGLYRVHQFHKVEQVIVDVADKARSVQHHHDIVSNAETGYFRPVPTRDDSLVVFRYSGAGFVPARIAPRPLTEVSAITFFGQQVIERHPELERWRIPPPSAVPIDSLITARGEYRPLREVRLMSLS